MCCFHDCAVDLFSLKHARYALYSKCSFSHAQRPLLMNYAAVLIIDLECFIAEMQS